MSEANWYFNIQKQVSELMAPPLKEVLEKADDNIRGPISPLIERKINAGANMRPLIFFIGYCIAKKKVLDIRALNNDDRRIIGEATAALELENISTYYINHYLDNKADIKDESDAKNRVLAGQLCRDLSHKIIADSEVFSDKQKFTATNTINEIDRDIVYAQFMDINKLIFKNIGLYYNQKDYLEEYFKRCRLISGQFYGRCAELGIKIGDDKHDEDLCENITDLYTNIASLGQFSNDIGDFAPPEMHTGTLEKNYYKDYGSDFLNGRLTYPNYLLLTRADEEDKKFLEETRETRFDRERIIRIIQMLKKYNIFDDSMHLLKSEFKKEKKNLKVEKGDLRTLISSSLILCKHNKLIKSIRDSNAF